MKPTHIRTFYPADPVGTVPGGVDTFMRGILKWAPDDLRFSVVGMTTDPTSRPLGQWSVCSLGRRQFDFFPVVRVNDAGQRSRVPLSLRYTAGTLRHLRKLKHGFDAFEFHRVEPGLLFRSDPRAKNAFFHQDMAVIRSEKADILWRKFPSLYFSIERRVVSSLSSAWCVREEGTFALRERYPRLADTIHFIPTWVDTEMFFPAGDEGVSRYRDKLGRDFTLGDETIRIATVGRLDSQKDPDLLLGAFGRLVRTGHKLSLLFIGDGVLRQALERRVEREGLARNVRFLGLRSPAQVAEILRGIDLFALSSAYEGMPMAVLEALGTGLPVATTEVGEVSKVVISGTNGSIAKSRSIEDFAACMADVVDNLLRYRGAPAVDAIRTFQPAEVLAPVYENYRKISGERQP